MAEFKLGRIKFVWKNDWATGTTYYKDDIVHYGGKTFLCVVGHQAASDFYTDLNNIPTKWNQFSDGQVWKGNWSASGTVYKINDIVKYGGDVYICNTGHTSQATLELDQGSWDLFAESFDWKGDWAISYTYKVNDVVKYGGYTYICNHAHTSAGTLALGLENNQGYWDLFSKGVDWKGAWAISTRYKVGDLVRYGSTSYVCNFAHTSAATTTLGLENNQGYWDYFTQGIEYKGAWSGSSVRYKINDVVKNGGGTWICTTAHTSTANFVVDQTNWNKFVEGVLYRLDWTSGNTYQPGDYVRYGGNNYISKTAHIAASGFPPSTNTTDWALFATGFKLAGDWATGGSGYRVGEVVRLNGWTYVAVADNVSQKPPNATYWAKLNEGIKWKNTWVTSTAYELGDAVKDGPNSYICIQSHTSSTPSKPANDTLGTYWNLLTGGNEESVLTTTGDLVYYGGAGATRLPVGDTGQVLSIKNGIPAWTYFGKIAKVFYVGPNGTNSPAPTYGLTIDQPWASVRYALTQIDTGYDAPNADYLLRYNRTFIQTEIVQWINYQITNNISPFTSSFSYDQTKCKRDMGLILDAVRNDLTKGGNVKSIAAAKSYYTALGTAYITSGFGTQVTQTVAAINYGLSLIGSVLANTAPAQNYQSLNGISVGSRVKQLIDTNYTAESTALATSTALVKIVTDALTAGNTNSLPIIDTPSYTLFVKTGQYYEVLPMRVPANTGIVGDELRGTRISPAGKIIATNDKAKSYATLQRLQAITANIITNTAVTPTSGNSATQVTTAQLAGNTGSATAVASVKANCTEIKSNIATGSASAYVIPDPSGYDTGFSNGRRLIVANKAFIQAEVAAYMAVNFTTLWNNLGAGGQSNCTRDIGYIIDALRYDLTYGTTGTPCNLATVIAARSYYSYGTFVEFSNEKTAALAVQSRIQSIIGYIATGNSGSWSKTSGNALTQDISGTPGSAGSGTYAAARIQEVYNTINTGTTPTTLYPSTAWVATALTTSAAALAAAKSEITTHATDYIAVNYPTLVYNITTCQRDVGYIVDSLQYDLMFGSNFLSIQSGLAYRRGTTSALYVIANQSAATQSIVDFISAKASKIVAAGAVVLADELWKDITGYINTGTRPIVASTLDATTDIDRINGSYNLRLNTAFMQAEAVAYIAYTYKSTVTASSTSQMSGGAGITSWMVAGDAIRFTGTLFGGVQLNTTYYVYSVDSGTQFKIVDQLGGGTPRTLSVGSGSMTVSYYYNSARCQNDVAEYIRAISRDMIYTGNYSSVSAARYYRNALTGSKLEDFYYVRNGCGVRNQTLTGLDGSSDGNTTGYQSALTTTVSAYNTKRPNAGAYVSLDPGWGPSDSNVWVSTKSTYVQNVTTFGIGCVGQKIDGSLHAGGNDSIVSNDFTQVLSDGIGAWVTNLGRAELVSVFTYYNYMGYLAENGGKIRATNGNNSYGTFGSVAEFIDVTETPITGFVNNRNAGADVKNVLTDGNNILMLEYGNAGSTYTSATYSFSGAGISAAATATEFRDNGVYQVRLVDPGDSTGGGGYNYMTIANTAQGGNAYSITIAAADNNGSAAYVGMAIYLTGGLGAGQYANILTYNSASKVATVVRDSFTPITVTATAITTNLVTVSSLTGLYPNLMVMLDTAIGGLSAYTPYYVKSVPASANIAIGYVARSSSTATITTAVAHGLATGHTVSIYNTGTALDSDLTKVITVVDAYNFTYTSGASGTITPSTLSSFVLTGTAGQFTCTSTTLATNQAILLSGTFGGTGSITVGATTYSAAGTTATAGLVFYVVAGGTGTSFQLSYTPGGTPITTTAGTPTGLTYTVGLTTTAVVRADSKITLGASTGSSTPVNLSTASGTVTMYGGGWDHVSGVPILSALGVTTTYAITPRLSFTAPTYTTTSTALPVSANWIDIVYGNGVGSYTAVTATGGSGSLASFDVTRINGVYTVTPNAPGVLYAVGNTLTIAGTSLGGTSPANDLTLTVTAVASGSQGVSAVTASGTAVTAKFVAIATGTTGTAYSTDGVSWTAGAMPSGLNFTAIDYGAVAGIGYYVAIATGTATAYYSLDGINWSAGAIGQSAAWNDIVYGNGKFVAIAQIDTVTSYRAVSSNGGATWTTGTFGQGSVAVTYGGTRYVVVQGGYSNKAAWSLDGLTWNTVSLPVYANWIDVTFGNNRFVAVADSSAATGNGIAAYSVDYGATWNRTYTPELFGYKSIQYGNGVFDLIGWGDTNASSTDGIYWTPRSSALTTVVGASTSKDTTAATYTATTLPASGYWLDAIWTGSKFIAIGHDNVSAPYGASSPDGITWTSVTLPTVSGGYTYSAIAYDGASKYVALIQDTRHIASSTDGVTWAGTINAIPTTGTWSDMVYGGGKFVAVSGGQNRTAYSTDGVTWTNGTISATATEYTAIAYGNPGTAYYVVVAGLTGNSQVSAYSTDGVTWTAGNTMPSADTWSSIVYGGGKFVAVAGSATTTSTKAAYSTNGTSWVAATMPGAAAKWIKVVYGGGAYTAYSYGGTRTAYSADGITWVEGPALSTTRNWFSGAYGNNRNVALPTGGSTGGNVLNFVLNTNYITLGSSNSLVEVGQRIRFDAGTAIGGLATGPYYYIVGVNGTSQISVSLTKGGSAVVLSTASGSMAGTISMDYQNHAYGNYNGVPAWVAVGAGTKNALKYNVGATTKARAYVTSGAISSIWINEPGSGYASAPTMTIIDPNNTGSDAPVTVRVGSGALAQPTYSNRGVGYAAATSSIVGNGYADNYQVSSYVGFTGLTGIPQPGANVQIAGIDKIWYRLVATTGLVLKSDGTYNATLQISPKIGNAEAPEHLTGTTIRRRYSQVRLTGHDFLSIGTGNQTNTNYPGLPLSDAIPANETKNYGGGRVFYTSTDQDGNFRVGGLFNVQQATGVATLNADAFNIAGLNQLSLGSVALGGTGAVISEFSTDPYFTLNSDAVVPTQRAIKAYITSQIGGGGSQLNVNTLTAGVIYIAGQTITTTTSVQININTKVYFKGGIDGTAMALNYFLLNN